MRLRSTRTIRYSVPVSPNGVSMNGECIVVPDQGIPPVSSRDSLVLRRRDLAAALRFWRRTDKTARRTLRQERINALMLFLIRNAISR